MQWKAIWKQYCLIIIILVYLVSIATKEIRCGKPDYDLVVTI